MQALENQFQKNKQISDNISRYKKDPTTNQTVVNGLLVYENGRYRRSGSSYLSIATPRSSHSARSLKAPSIKLSNSKIGLRDKGRGVGLSESRRSSRASVRSKAESHKSLSGRFPVVEHKIPKLNRQIAKPQDSSLSRTSARKVDSQRSISKGYANLNSSYSGQGQRPHKTYASARNEKLLKHIYKLN